MNQPNFDFIARAGEQVAEGITAYDAAKKLNIDDTRARRAHELLLNQAKTEFKKATGIDDDVKATAFAVRYFPEKFQGESAMDAVNRWEKADPLFKNALNTLKVEGYHSKVQQPIVTPGTPAEPQPSADLAARLQSEQATGVYPGGRYDAQGKPITGPQQPPITGTPIPATPEQRRFMTAQERYDLAQKQGILKDETVYADVTKTGREALAGQQFPAGTTSSQVYQQEMQTPILDKMGEGYHTQFPTQKDVMTNDRLTKQAEQRARLSDMANKLRERKLALEARQQNKSEEYKLLENQIDLINTQIRASEQVTKTALGISTGKDLLGQTTFYTGPEIDAIQKDNESTLQSAQDLLERVNKKNEAIIPPTPPKPVPKSKFKIVEVQ